MIFIQNIFKTLKNQNKKSPIYKGRNDLNRHFNEEDIQMKNKYMKGCLSSLIIRKI